MHDELPLGTLIRFFCVPAKLPAGFIRYNGDALQKSKYPEFFEMFKSVCSFCPFNPDTFYVPYHDGNTEVWLLKVESPILK